MLILRFQDVYDPLFPEIGQNSMEFLSAAISLEFIDSDHFRKLQRFAVLNVPEEADDGRDGQTKLTGDRRIGAAIPEPVDHGKDGSSGHALIPRQEAVRFRKALPAGTGIPAFPQNEDNRLFESGEFPDTLQAVIVDLICHPSASGTLAHFPRLFDENFVIFFRLADFFDRKLLQSEQLFCIISIEHI